MNTNKQKNRPDFIEQPTFESTVSAELSADYILPDVYPDVKKLLRVTARPVLIGRFVSGKRLEFTGAVDYLVLFSAESDNGDSLHSVHFSGEWNSSVGDLDDLERSDIYISPYVASCTARPSNPRKLSIRCTVASDVKITKSCPCDLNILGTKSPSEELTLEKLTETIPMRTLRTFIAEPLRMSENIELDPALPSIDEIISCTVNLHMYEAKPRIDGHSMTVALKGTAFADCIYKSLSEPLSYRSFSKGIPVSCTVNADEYAEHFGACPPDSLFAKVTAVPAEINAEVGEDSYGERRVVELDMTADLNVRLFGSAEAPLTLDAYSTARTSECTFTPITTTLPTRTASTNFSVSETVPKENLVLPDTAVVLDGSVTISPLKLSLERGRSVLTGSATVSCIYTSEAALSSAEAVIPLRFELNIGEVSERTAHICDAVSSGVRCTVRDGALSVDFEACISAEVWERSDREILDSITLTDTPSVSHSGADITLCYPTKSESLWDIAKRYSTTSAAIEAANSGGARVLMIPRTAPKSFVI